MCNTVPNKLNSFEINQTNAKESCDIYHLINVEYRGILTQVHWGSVRGYSAR